MEVLACRYLEIPFIGYDDDFGLVAPRDLVELALRTFTKFNDELVIMPKKDISGADSLLKGFGSQSAAATSVEKLSPACHFRGKGLACGSHSRGSSR